MKRSDLVRDIQILLESRGYVGNGDDGDAVVEYLEDNDILPAYDSGMSGEWESEDE